MPCLNESPPSDSPSHPSAPCSVPTLPPPPPPASLNSPIVLPAYPPPPPQPFYNMFSTGKRVRLLPSMNPQRLKLAGNSATVTSGWALGEGRGGGGTWEPVALGCRLCAPVTRAENVSVMV